MKDLIMRKLVTIRTISDLQPIEGADRIEVASIDGWRVVVGKNEFKVGDKCLYFEIDSFIPEKLFSELPFLEKNAITWKGKRGTRIRTIKLKKQISQGLAVSLMTFPTLTWTDQNENKGFFGLPTGFDGTIDEFLGVELWEPEVNSQSANFGNHKGNFPNFIRKTDQERLQNLWHEVSNNMWDYHKDDLYEITQKLDGTSCTMYFNEGTFGVCSRNFELKDDKDPLVPIPIQVNGPADCPECNEQRELMNNYQKRKSIMWELARKYHLYEKLKDRWQFLAIQGEVIGPGVNKNHDGLKEVEFYVFDIYNCETKLYLDSKMRLQICDELGLLHAPVVGYRPFNFNTIDEALKFTEGKSELSDKEREGIVFKNTRNTNLSFKIINNKYLLKHGE